MELSTFEIGVQATIAIFVIVNPVDPVKIIIFNDVVARQGLNRKAAALKVAIAGFAFLGDLLARMKPAGTARLARIGGVLLATIGVQLLLGGLKAFYAG